MVKRFIKYYKPYKVLFFLDLLAAFLFAGCGLIYPIITRIIMDEAVINKDLNMIITFGVILAIIFFIKALLNYFMQYFGHVVGARMQSDMREEVFTHLQKLPNSFFNEHKTGDIMSRIVTDLMDISELAHHGPEDLFISIMLLLGSFFILLGINVELTLIVFLALPFIFIFTITKRKAMDKAFSDTRVKTGEVNQALSNSIGGIRITKSFCTEELEKRKFEKANKFFRHAREDAYKIMAEYFSGTFLAIDILEMIVLIAAGYFACLEKISIGDFAAYLLYVKMFIEPIKKLVNFTEQYENGMTGFRRVLEILDTKEEFQEENPIHLKEIKGEISIKGVSFSYEDEKILDNINLNIKKGKTVALVGPSGGGKTTLCNLIPRFFDYTKGKIEIDGIDIKKLSLLSLRKNIGVVSQEVFLFAGTIKDNILIGNPKASDEEIIESCKKARIHDFILNLKEGYNTYVGERGVKLSGGQRQRISIARIFLKNPPILILDEATSALDNVTESEIQKSFEELGKGRTSIIVAHRLSTIKNVDEIVVLTEKGIEEKGSHKDLLNNNGVYAKLCLK